MRVHSFAYQGRSGWYVHCDTCGCDVMDLDGYDCKAGAVDAADTHDETHDQQDEEDEEDEE